MIDPVQLPLLLKALDFLFDEGSKILQERREKRLLELSREKDEEKKSEKILENKTNETELLTKNLVQDSYSVLANKDKLQTTPVIEEMWLENKDELSHTLELLKIYSDNYNLAKKQSAMWGEALVPTIVIHNLNEAEKGFMVTYRRAEQILARIYGKSVDITSQLSDQ